MTRIKIKEIVWDEWNLDHVKKHNVSIDEIIEVSKKIIYHRQTYKERYLVICRGSKRLITLILKRESSGKYYLITARDSSKKERKDAYAKEK